MNEIAVKTLAAGMLGLKIIASLDALVGQDEFPRKLVLDYPHSSKSKKNAA